MIDDDSEELIPAAAVRRRQGGISDMTLYRRLNDPSLGFPKPLYIGRLRFWRLAELEAWERSLPRERARKAG
jgi:predicted DNA-binding transcriptional regulator AlpA